MDIPLFDIVFGGRVFKVLVTGCHVAYVTFPHAPDYQSYHDAEPQKGKQEGEADGQANL